MGGWDKPSGVRIKTVLLSVFARRFQKLAPLQHHRSPSPDQPVNAHYHRRDPSSALFQLGHNSTRQCRPHHHQLHTRRSTRSCSAGTPGMQRCQFHPHHHSGPHWEQHPSERAVGCRPGWTPHPPDPRQCATICLKAVRHHQPADAQSLWSVIHGHGLQVRPLDLCLNISFDTYLMLNTYV